ncbi:hypothetical protein [Bergeyella sp. RCAD1439]|uniref:hypothetical protein n=1 Tax=Bergeyella anatis TaxID=3113737 RepID=UPI002E17B25F|nr:hypothetical protein [Bergeyella sp. RCAD1439]
MIATVLLKETSKIENLNKIFSHFLFRIKQGLRIFNLMPKLSFPIILILGGLTIVKLPENDYYPMLFSALTAFFHFNRKDVPFLKKIFVRNWRLILFLENVLLYSFFLLINVNYEFEKIGIIGIIAISFLSFLFLKSKPDISLKWNFVPNHLFEWKSFLRKYSWLSIIVFAISIISGYQTATLIFCGIFLLDFSAVFGTNESKEMLEMYFKKFDFNFKIRKNLIFLNLLLLPSYLVFIFFNHEQSLYLIYYMAFINLYYLLILTRKYKNYHHKEKTINYNIGIYLEYFFCSITIIPAIFILNSNIKSAKKNLKHYVGN